MSSFGMRDSASHSEFIKSKETGEYFFLETSSRVGGANLAEMVEAASGMTLLEAENTFRLVAVETGFVPEAVAVVQREWERIQKRLSDHPEG